MADVQGHNANKSGKWLEKEVEETLNGYGFQSVDHKTIGKKFGNKVSNQDIPGFLIKNSYYTDMFGKRARGEFVLQVSNKGSIRIECRRQTVRGSVDDKATTLLGNAVSCEEKNVILIIDGGGMAEEKRRYVVDSARAIKHKSIRVFNLKQFKSWAKRAFSDTGRDA